MLNFIILLVMLSCFIVVKRTSLGPSMSEKNKLEFSQFQRIFKEILMLEILSC